METLTETIELTDRDFLTADLHIGGAPWPYRLWFKKENGDPIDQVRETAGRIWDYQVSAESTILIIGDALDGRAMSIERELAWFDERPGKKILIPGNHDLPHPMFGIDEDKLRAQGWFDVFDIRPAQTTMVKLGGFKIPACHYPSTERQQARWAHVRASEDLPVLHGHTHSRKGVGRTAAGVLQINVGWPGRKKLTAVPEILEELKQPWKI